MALEVGSFISSWEAGEPFSVAVDELQVVENALRHRYLPITELFNSETAEEMERNWQHSQRFVDALRGKTKHIGLRDVNVEPIAAPYDALVAAKVTNNVPERAFGTVNTLGFYVTAQMTSSAKPEAGQLRKPVWLLRRPKANAVVTSKAWLRLIGPNEGDNSIDEVYKTSRQRATTMRGLGYSLLGTTTLPHARKKS